MKNSLDIIIPDRAYSRIGGAYGDQYVAALYCGYSEPPQGIEGEWQHGWIVPEWNMHPEMTVGGDGRSYERRDKSTYFVARQDQEDYLKSLGYRKVFAIGLPIVYVERPKVRRVPGSLLIMPRHSLSETRESWNAEEYADFLQSIAARFSLLCACIHKTCIDKRNWVDPFQDRGIRIVEGADEADRNSLMRMAYLFSQFEFMTSNAFGSHIAYASYFGCKVSVSGPRAHWKRSDSEKTIFYRNAPAVLDLIEQWNTEDHWAKYYPQFLANPWDAIVRTKWAQWQVGEQHKKSPRELRKLLGWDFVGRVSHRARRATNTVRAAYRFAKQHRTLVATLGIPGVIAAIQLRSARKKAKGRSRIWCGWKRRITVRNGTSDIDVFQQHFVRREIFDISLPKDARTVVDLGANIGISVEVFRQIFPRAKIIGVELEEENARLCRLNHAKDGMVTILNGAIWPQPGHVGLKDVGEGEWAYQAVSPLDDRAGTITAFTYSQILDLHDLGKVDVMKMDIEGAEADVLEASWADIFGRTAVSIIEIHEWIEGVEDRVWEVMASAKAHFDLEVSRSGEFWVIRNRKLVVS